jgi:hypothetical protein
MFTELHYHTNRELRSLDLAQKMAERRGQALAATRRSSLRALLSRMLFAPAVSTERHEARSTTRNGSEATGRA